MFYMRYSIIFSKFIYKMGAFTLHLLCILILFLFLSQEEKKGIYVSPHLPRSELKPHAEQINSRMQHVLLLLACGYASQLSQHERSRP